MTPTGTRRSSSPSPLSRTRRPTTRSSGGSAARARTCRAMPARRISSSRSRSMPPADRVFWACSRSSLLAARSAAASEVRPLAIAPSASAIWLSVARAMSPVAPPAPLAALELGKGHELATVVGRLEAGDGVAVRAGGRTGLAEDALLDLGRDDVLPRVGLLVGAVPRDLQDVDEQALGEAVAPDQRGRHLPALRAEGDLPVGDGHEPFLREAADLLRDGGGRDAESLGDPSLGDPAALLLHRVDGFEVFLCSLGDLDRAGRLLHWVLPWSPRSTAGP